MNPAKKKALIISLCSAAGAVVIGVAVLLLVLFLGNDCAHDNRNYELTLAATCQQEGKRHVTCLDCGEDLGEETLPKAVHNYAKNTQSSVAATCTAVGKDVFKCSVCNDTYETELAQLSHDFKEVTAEKVVATCTTAGKTVMECAICHTRQTDDIAALGHAWQLWSGDDTEPLAAGTQNLKAADCVARKCDTCGEKAHATELHDFVETADTATCTGAGKKTLTCSACNYQEIKDSAPKGHVVETWTKDTAYEVAVPGATCTYEYRDTGVCTTCGEPQETKYQSVSHNYELGVVDEATCNYVGKKQMMCTVCQTVDPSPSNQAIEYKVEHTFGDEVAGVKTCTACGETRKTVTNGSSLTVDELKQEIELDTGAVVRLPDNAGVAESATLTADKHGKGDLDPATPGLDRVGDNDEIFDLTLTEDGEPITEFGSKVFVKFPYTLKDGEDPNRVTIFYLGANGVELVDAAFTPNTPGAKEGTVSFMTDHFSYYLVGLYQDSDLCEKFGHTYLVSAKPATCTEGGYYIETCKRCGKYGVKQILSAKGHTPVRTGGKEANCTTNGYDNVTCAVCAVTYQILIPATGHVFLLDSTVPEVVASCTQAGSKTEKCTLCGVQHSITLPQLPHSLSSVVVPATCTTEGYTTHTCQTCDDYTYTTSYVPATGHTWDIAAPTCAAGQNCLACGAKGAAATGNHNTVNGQCTVCGYGCQHADTVKETVAPTCTVGGYTVYLCSKCNREEKRDYKEALGHSFPNDLEPCTACDIKNPKMAEAVEKLMQSLASTGYTVRLENVKVDVKLTTTYPKNYPTNYIEENPRVNTSVTTLNLGELYLSFADEKIMVYMNGSATATVDNSEETASITVYGDGENLYIAVTAPNGVASEDIMIRANYEAFFSYVWQEVQDAMMGGSTGGGSSNNPGSSNPGGSSDLPGNLGIAQEIAINGTPMSTTATGGTLATIEETLKAMLETYLKPVLEHPAAQLWLELLQEKKPEMYEAYGQLLLFFYKSEAVDNGYKYSFDFAKLQEFNKNLKELTMAEVIDTYFGEGATDAVFAYLDELQDKKLIDFMTEIVLFADEVGIPSDLIFNTLNTVIPEVMGMPEGTPFDIVEFADQMLTQALGISDATVLDLYNMLAMMSSNVPAYDAVLEMIKTELEENIAYGYIPEDMRDMIFGIYDTMLDEDTVDLYFVVDKDGKLYSVGFGYNEFEWNGETTDTTMIWAEDIYGEGSYKNYKIENAIELKINMELSLLFSAAFPADANAIKLAYETLAADLEADIKTAYAAMKAENPEAVYLNGMFIVKDGVVYANLVESIEWGEETEPPVYHMIELPLASLPMLGVMEDCTDSYSVAVWGVFGRSGDTFYWNNKTGAVQADSFHKFNKEATTYPDGYYTFDNAPCNHSYGTMWQCDCGDLRWEYEGYKDHLTYQKVEGTDCSGTVTVKEICDYCEKTVSEIKRVYKDQYNYSNYGGYLEIYSTHLCNEELISVLSNHAEVTGPTYFWVGSCPCGHTDSFDYRYRAGKMSCEFGSETWIQQDESSDYSLYISHCAIEDCDIAVVIRRYDTTSNGCDRTRKTVYEICRIGEGDVSYKDYEVLGTYTVEEKYEYHAISSVITSGWNDDETTYTWHATCRNCDIAEYYTYTNDGNGDRTYYQHYITDGGVDLVYTEERTKYTTIDACRTRVSVEAKNRRNGAFTASRSYIQEHHLYGEEVLVKVGTCTKPEYWKKTCTRDGCGHVSNWSTWHHHDYDSGHKWVETEEGSEFAYECAYCHLTSNKGNGYLSLEDLTNNADYKVDGSFAIGFYNWYNSYYSFKFIFSFVPSDEFYGDGTAEPLPDMIGFIAASVALAPGSSSWDGVFCFSKDSVMKAIEALLDTAGVETAAEFMAQYDLAIQIEEPDNTGVGDGTSADRYTVIVLEDLASYFPAN